ncbi:MAG: SDR family oxidoreductase [Terracidiphilus sp.]|jgi:NAD(P)-dependent dehydrogenase (short-subunit alcohol dehydrogenase family)
MSEFAGKVALVTGGSSGIGKATALAFAKAGASVVIAARGEQRGNEALAEITAAGGKAIFVPTDVSKSADMERLVARTVETFGRLDYAFNNAANAGGSFGLTAELTEEDFDQSIAINLKSVWLGMKYQIRQMLAQEPRGGAIVNTSSGNGLGGCAGASFYAAAKAGVIALSKSAALEYAKQGIRVNALVAGAFQTPMLEGAMDRAAGGNPEALQAIQARWKSMIAAGRIGDPAEAASAVLWLCSDASSYVVGHSLIVDGGLTALWR